MMTIETDPNWGDCGESVVRVEIVPKARTNFRQWMPSAGAPATLLGVILMSFADICLELSTQDVNPIQVTILFNVAVFLTSVSGVFINSVKDKYVLSRRYQNSAWFYLLLCSCANGVALITYIFAIEMMPVGDAVSILRIMPVFGGLFGCILLKQALRVIDIPYILCCIAGVVLVARPTFIFPMEEDSTENNKLMGTVFAVVSAACFAASFSIGKKISDYNINVCITISLNSSMSLLMSCVIWFFSREWDCSTVESVIFMLAAGFLTAIGQMLVFWSVSREKVVVVTVILTSNIIFTYILQIVIVKIIPHWLSAIGASLILIACIGMALRKNGKLHDLNDRGPKQT